MTTIRLHGRITEDRRLIVDLPDDLPAGEVEVEVVLPSNSEPSTNAARERARSKLAAAGKLSTVWIAPPETQMPTEEELIELGTVAPGKPVDQLIDEDRGQF